MVLSAASPRLYLLNSDTITLTDTWVDCTDSQKQILHDVVIDSTQAKKPLQGRTSFTLLAKSLIEILFYYSDHFNERSSNCIPIRGQLLQYWR
jgi:hypothetical protein